MSSDPRDEGCLCQGCGRRFRVELWLPDDDLWNRIRYPDNPNLLCGICMMERIEQIGKFDYFDLTKPENEMSVWQPIGTAPVNKSVLIYIPNAEHYGEGIYRALLVESEWKTLEDGSHPRHWQTTGLHIGRDCLSQLPTHWMPLPSAPNTQEAKTTASVATTTT